MSGSNSSKKGRNPSDPFAELAVKNAKYVKNCVELFMAGRGIEKIRGFERFVNLEVLWLNNNKITKLNNLANNFRIKFLYAHDNNIRTLFGDIEEFKFLTMLTLFNNDITDLDKQLEILSKFQYLEQLDMYGNPVAEETNYRLRVINAVPSVHVLDNSVVTDEERQDAARLAKRSKRTGGSAIKRDNDDDDNDDDDELEDEEEEELPWVGSAKDLMDEVAEIKREMAKREEDRRAALYKEAMAAKARSAGGMEHLTKEEIAKMLLPKALDFLAADESRSSHVLGAWDNYFMKKRFEDENKKAEIEEEGVLTRKELTVILDEMSDAGRCLSEGSRKALSNLFDAIEDDETKLIGWDAFWGAITGSSGVKDGDGNPVPPLQWNRISAEAAKKRAAKLYSKGATLHRKAMMTIGDSEEDTQKRKDMLARAHDLAHTASRLESIFHQEDGTYEKESRAEEQEVQRGDFYELYEHKEDEGSDSKEGARGSEEFEDTSTADAAIDGGAEEKDDVVTAPRRRSKASSKAMRKAMGLTKKAMGKYLVDCKSRKAALTTSTYVSVDI